ncbi:hypothetical protein H0E87_025051 [Populus deltoides]|uniref:Uncharacterized protein n=1 Tax=Populus deltoides TaxID=3696 RepID=A0A8T2XBA4_POPDE|nr:hypothetical protein H0E87_025051 [Populus deltoides]
MAAILASQGCYCRHIDLMNEGRILSDNLSFSSSVSNPFVKFDRKIHNLIFSDKLRMEVEMRQTESPASKNLGSSGPPDPKKLGSNGRVIKMVPTSEVVKKRTPNGNRVDIQNRTKQVINGATLAKRDSSAALVKSTRSRETDKLPPLEDFRVLPTDEGFSWADENYNDFRRTIDIWSFVLALRVRVTFDNAKWAYVRGFTEDKQKSRRRRTASWLRECVLQLGPTFIKLGQLSSTRSDLFPREFVDELAKLQDRVPAFSPKKARSFIERELGAPIDVLFKAFEDQPIAAASLGQVHRAILHNGEKVVVKVQRPGLKKLFDIDLRNLKLIAEYFQRSETFGGASRDWIGIYEECKRILYEEIDYINEGKNADRFAEIFEYKMGPSAGVKINHLDMLDSRGYDRSRISSRAIEAYLIQILKTGFFHADPHPGNLAVDVDESLIYYDFGMMGEIKTFTRKRLLELFYAVYEKDAKKVIQSLIDLEALQPTGDLSSVRRSVQFFLNNLLSQTPDQQQTLAAIGEDLFAIAQDQPFLFPSTFTFVIRAFSTLEGIGYILDPDFSFVKIAAPYAQELLDGRQRPRNGTQLVEEIRKQANDARSSTISMPYRIQRIEDFVKQLEAGDLKLRVRVLESERAARKATILQMATMYTVLGGTLLNLGVTFSNQGSQVIANGSFIGAGVFLTLLLRSMQRVKKLDKFEKMIFISNILNDFCRDKAERCHVCVVGVARTPMGAFLGSLSSLPATKLGSIAIEAALKRANVDPSTVQEVFFGNVLCANLGQAPARQAALGAGISNSVVCTTINKVCASGMKATMLAAQSIQLGINDVVVAGGMESMSNVPKYLAEARKGSRLGHDSLVDGMLKDGLWDVYNDYGMGNCAELCADTHSIPRDDQPVCWLVFYLFSVQFLEHIFPLPFLFPLVACLSTPMVTISLQSSGIIVSEAPLPDSYAIQSFERGIAAQDSGAFAWEIVPVEVPGGRGRPSTIIDKDEGLGKFDPAKLRKLRPSFKESGGSVTAGNASSISDGAAALVLVSGEKALQLGLKVLAKVTGYADAAQAPELFTTAPALAIPKAISKAGLDASQVDYYEINEAFAVVALANQKLLGLNPEKVNVHGGAVSLGHPLGCSGARILVTLLGVLKQKHGKYGVGGVCNGGGGASAVVVELL